MFLPALFEFLRSPRLVSPETIRCRKRLLKLFDPNVLPGNIVGASSALDAMNLKADETFRMSLKDLFVRQISNGFAIDPCLNVSTFRDNAEFVPLAVLHNFVRLQVFFAGQPSAPLAPRASISH